MQGKRCGAKTRQGSPCRNRPVTGARRCRMHGGTSRRGIAHPQFKNGRYCKHLPGRLIERFREALTDRRALELRDEIALLDARVTDLLQRLDTGESGGLWRRLARLLDEADGARRAGDMPAFAALLAEAFAAARRGADEHERWNEIRALIDERRRLVESERKRLVESRQMISLEQAATLYGAIVEGVVRVVRDPAQLREIQRVFDHVTQGVGSVEGAEGPPPRLM